MSEISQTLTWATNPTTTMEMATEATIATVSMTSTLSMASTAQSMPPVENPKKVKERAATVLDKFPTQIEANFSLDEHNSKSDREDGNGEQRTFKIFHQKQK